jgi:hypothetical protein
MKKEYAGAPVTASEPETQPDGQSCREWMSARLTALDAAMADENQ